MKKKFLAFFVCLAFSALVSGCLSVPLGYCDKKEFAPKHIPATKKYPITFSVHVIDNVNGKDPKAIAQRIEKALVKTNLFSSVNYSAYPQQYSYHLNFNIWLSGSAGANDPLLEFWAGMTCGLLPFGVDFFGDIGANLYLRGENIASFGKTELVRQIWWLPLVVVSPLTPIIETHTYYSVIDAIVCDIATYHYNRFILEKELMK